MGIQDQICFIKGTRYDADYIRLQGLRDMHLMVPLHLGAMSANPPSYECNIYFASKIDYFESHHRT